MASSSAPEDNNNIGDLVDLLCQPDNQSSLHGWPVVGPEESQFTLFMEEDEMTGSWFQYQIGANQQGGGSGSGSSSSVYCNELLNMPVAAAVGSSDSCRLTMEAMKIENNRKRKVRDIDDDNGGKSIVCHSKDAGTQHDNKKKEVHQPLMTRMRDAEIHNLSERRRRDRINEKMKTLQELIPRCNKSNKASMLDDAIEYTKSLQMQAEMMMSSMHYNMNHVMSPNAQRYFPTMGFMGMGMNMGMASSVEVGAATLQQPRMPLGLVLPYAPIVGHAQISHLHPPLMLAFPLPNMAYANELRAQASNLVDPAFNPANIRGPNVEQIPNVSDKHHRHVGTNRPQESAQNRPMSEPGQQKKKYYSEATGG